MTATSELVISPTPNSRSYLNHFTQPDSIVPDPANTQAWDRYAYALNNPVRYSDPSGHRPDDGCGKEGGCSITKQTIIDDYRRDKDFKDTTARNKCNAGDYNYCSTIDLFIKRRPKPVSGIHVGYSGQAGYGLEGGVYDQWDFLIDWKEGNLYIVQTAGAFGYGGTPTGMLGEVYMGTSNVHGVPGDVEDLSNLLAGPQFDASVEVGVDAAVEAGYIKGISVDLDTEGNPYHTLGAGYMYTTENSIELGFNEIPNAMEIGGQLGGSESFIMWVVPLW